MGNRTFKTRIDICYVKFWNSDSSFNIRSIPTKFLGDVLYHTPEGSVSHNLDLGPG